ncbi:MAG TPA: Calx-beta domain-containing protein [Nocardioidaceae bacterium]
MTYKSKGVFTMQFVPARKPRSVWRTLILFFAALLTFGVLVPLTASAHGTALLRVHDKTVVETDSGLVAANVRITLDHRVGHRVSVGWFTASGTAKAFKDFRPTSGRAVFPRGHQVAFARVLVKGDLLDERTEFFKVKLFDPHRAVIADRVGIVTILDNDPRPNLAINDTHVTEGNHAVLTVILSAKSGRRVSVNWTTADGTATSLHDYVADRDTLTFSPGETSKTIAVETLKDNTNEGDETFVVRLSDPVHATINPNHATGNVTIVANHT